MAQTGQNKLSPYECDIFKVNNCSLVIDFEPKSAKTTAKFVFVTNMNDKPEVLTIEPPVSRYFSAEYTIPYGQVLPGRDIRITIRFLPKPALEFKPYYDRMRVICRKGCAHIIKLTASPNKRSILNIPQEINLGNVPLGSIGTAKIELPPIQQNMSFAVISNSCSTDLIINPMKGTVVDSPAIIEFSYTPNAYVSVSFPIHIYLPTLTSKPYFVNITAETRSGVLKQICCDREKKEANKSKPKINYPPVVPKVPSSPQEDITWSHHQTNVFLLEKDKDICEHGMKVDNLGRPWSFHEEFKKREQEKFMNKVEEVRKLLDCGNYHKKEIIFDKGFSKDADSDMDWKIPDNEIIFNESIFHTYVPQRFKGRDLFFTKQRPQPPSFEKQQNPWLVRYMILGKFIDAARTICIQNRLLKRLAILKKMRREDIDKMGSQGLYDD